MALPGCISVPTWNTVDAEDADEMTESFYLVLLPSVHSVSYYSITNGVTVSSAVQSDPAIHIRGFPRLHSVTESAWQCRRQRFNP